jgi:hypothetical protein
MCVGGLAESVCFDGLRRGGVFDTSVANRPNVKYALPSQTPVLRRSHLEAPGPEQGACFSPVRYENISSDQNGTI